VPNSQRLDDSLSEELPVIRMRARIDRQQALNAFKLGELEQALSYLARAADIRGSDQDIVQQALMMSQILLRQGLDDIVRDPVFGVLPESTLSCPSTAQAERRRSKDPSKPTAMSPKKTPGPSTVSRDAPSSRSRAFTEYLGHCLASLTEIQELAQKASATSVLHTLSESLANVSMMLSATCRMTSKTSISPVAVAHALGRPPPLSYPVTSAC
jgi:hypothetical protein